MNPAGMGAPGLMESQGIDGGLVAFAKWLFPHWRWFARNRPFSRDFGDERVFQNRSGFGLWPGEVGGIPGPQVRGTGGTLICGLETWKDRGHRYWCRLISTGLCLAIALLLLFISYGFLPTNMRTTADDPLVTTKSFSTLLSDGGSIEADKAFLRKPPTWTGLGHSVEGLELRESVDSVESTSISTPVRVPRPTRSSGLSPNTFMLIIGTGDGATRFHPAACKAASICFKSDMDSSSAKQVGKLYSVPSNCLSRLDSADALRSVRGVFSHLSFSSALASRRVASANCCSAPANRDTASAAFSFADVILSVNPPAKAIALALAWVALSDSESARLAAFAASTADDLALPAFRWASAKRISLKVCNWPSARFWSISKIPSPATPTTTNIHPTKPISLSQRPTLLILPSEPVAKNVNVLGHSSWSISGPSIATPITTTMADHTTPANRDWLKACRSSRMPLSIALIASGEIDMARELDNDTRKTAWVVTVLRIIAALGIFYAVVISIGVVKAIIRLKFPKL